MELDDAISEAGGSATLVVMDLLDRPALPRLAGRSKNVGDAWIL